MNKIYSNMNKIYNWAFLALATLALASCNPNAPEVDELFVSEDAVKNMLDAEPNGYKIYTLDEFVDKFMTEEGDSLRYRSRSEASLDDGKKYYFFTVDTLPTDGEAIYIRGRITTDDYGGNFYKSLVIQQIVDGKQQNLRLGVDIGSASGLYQIGQEIIIRCNGLAVGRYANQVQLCVPSYNNNINAQHADEKIGWAPGRIPNPVFRRIATLIGTPDQSKLMYDTITMAEFINLQPYASGKVSSKEYLIYKNQRQFLLDARKMDGRLVVIKDVHFTNEYVDYGMPATCTGDNPDDPDSGKNAGFFGPTTGNLGFPQGRVISNTDGTYKTLVSTSEYARYAYYYLPEAKYVGSVTGILGYYQDKGSDPVHIYKWSITPRDIFKIQDIKLFDSENKPWVPVEYEAPKTEE